MTSKYQGKNSTPNYKQYQWWADTNTNQNNIKKLAEKLEETADAGNYFMENHNYTEEERNPEEIDTQNQIILNIHKEKNIILTSGKNLLANIINKTLYTQL